MYSCKQQGSSSSFPRGLARVKRLISFKKEAGRGFASRLSVTAGETSLQTSQKSVVALGLALAGCGSSATAGGRTCAGGVWRHVQTASACFRREGSCTGRKIKRHGSIFPADRSFNTSWDLGSGSSVKFNLACLKDSASTPQAPDEHLSKSRGNQTYLSSALLFVQMLCTGGKLEEQVPFL